MIIDLDRFAEEERPYWLELEARLHQFEQMPAGRTSYNDAKRLHYLYERAAAGLGKIQTFSAEPELRAYLEALVARAYGELHAFRAAGRRISIREWLLITWPRTFRRHLRAFGLSVAVTLAGCAFGWLALALDPGAKEVIMPFSHLLGEPSERVAREERREERRERDRLEGHKAEFSAMLMSHNIRVAIMVLAFGVTWGVGTIILLFYNGVILGAVALDYMRAGETTFLLGWLLPHGAVEIPAILIAGQAGLVAAHALLVRKARLSLARRLREVSADLLTLIGGLAILLVWAGIVEAFLSQVHEPTIPYSLKIGLGVAELVALGLFLGRAGSAAERGRQAEAAT